MLNILLFTQDPDLINKVNILTRFIECNIKTARTRKEAIAYVCNNPVKLGAIDLDFDGDGFWAALKLIDDKVPIVVFSNKNTEEDKLSAFGNGCDDYILKSTSPKEMQFRFQSILKRSIHVSDNISVSAPFLNEPISLGKSVIDFDKRYFYTPQENIALSKKEANLLRLFYLNKGKLLKREEILKEIWNTSDYYASKSMDVYLSKLRKILSSEESVTIQNIHGTGYMFVEQELVPTEV
jgi:DNA-binding response OmpR family regulator